jgi:hypothetical protein
MASEPRSLNVHLGSETRAKWDAYCKRIGLAPGAAIKKGIEQQLAKANDQQGSKVYTQVKDEPDDGEKVRLELRLTPSEKKAIEQASELAGCSQQQWVIDAIRAGLTHAPHYSMEEMKVLGESNYQLLAIGRTLNQMAKKMNSGEYEPEAAKSIGVLKRLINQHTGYVADTIRANLDRWSIV